jgi:hypothetical protein
MAIDPPTFSLGDFDKNPGQSPQIQGPGPKPAEASSPPPPVEAAPRSDADFQSALSWLYGFAAGHISEDVRKSAVFNINSVEDYLIYRREELAERRAELDPRVTWSADYQLAEKLGDQLERLNASLGTLRMSLLERPTTAATIQHVEEIKANLEAAIKTCNTLGLPF